MTSLALAAALALAANSPETYADAHKASTETGKPMVVLVGADWCPACKQMKDKVLPQLRERGALSRVGFALVNFDREKDLAGRLTNNGPIPQLLLFRRDGNGWKLRRLVGGHDVKTVETFIAQGIEPEGAAKSDEKAVAELPKAELPKAEKTVSSESPSVSHVSTSGARRGRVR